MLEKVKQFFLAHKSWLILPLIVVGVLWLWRRVRGLILPTPTVAPVAGPSKKEVEAAKEVIKEQAEGERTQAQQENEDRKKRVLDKFGPGIMLILLFFLSCAPQSIVRPEVTSAEWEAMFGQCQVNEQENVATCPCPVFSTGMQAWSDCLNEAVDRKADLKEARGLLTVDLQAAVARAQNAEGLLAQERNRKWVWGVVGVAGGLILGAGIVSVAVFGK
jgi:hypothetical protein